MKFNLIQTAGVIAIVLSGIVSFYFIHTRKEKTLKNQLLAGVIIVYAFMIACSLILSTGKNVALFKWAHIGNQIVFLVGPFLYFYIKSIVNPDFQLNKSLLPHAMPFMTASLYLVIKFNFIHIPITCRSNHILVGSAAFLHTLVYFSFSIAELKRSKVPTNNNGKGTKENKLAWVLFFIYGCFSIWLVKLLFFIVWDVSGLYNGCNEIANTYFLISFILLTAFTYFLLLNPDYFDSEKKYKHSGLDDEEKLKYKSALLSLMENKEVYRNSLISLNSLAKQLSVPNRYLSQVLNETLDTSFYDFINSYRIKDCVAYLSNPDYSHKTILEIAYEVGFNSKSTFNASFVRFVGTTPKEFRKKHQPVETQMVKIFA